jgi:transposase InsO family protein
VRDSLVGWCEKWADATGKPVLSILGKLGIYSGRYYDWRRRRGFGNRHNGASHRRTWIPEDIRKKVVAFYLSHPEDGYRRCAYMMLDADIAAVCPATVFNILKAADVLRPKHAVASSRRGKGFEQPEWPHRDWHTDITYITVGGRYYFLITVIDGFSRYIIHSELRESMTGFDCNIVISKAIEKFPEAVGKSVKVISDNGKQYIGREFRCMLGAFGMSHVTTSPYYPQSNGKIERWHKTLKIDIREKHLADPAHAQRIVDAFVRHYNEVRLHSAIGYVTPKDMLEGRQKEIHDARDRKLDEARRARGAASVKRISEAGCHA